MTTRLVWGSLRLAPINKLLAGVKMAGDNTQRTWRQEDLHELQEGQENCLADELQSGLYLSEFSSDSMK